MPPPYEVSDRISARAPGDLPSRSLPAPVPAALPGSSVVAGVDDLRQMGVEAVLKQARNALGYARLTRQTAGLLLEGTGSFRGLGGRYSLLFTPAGKFLQRLEGPLGMAAGFDGVSGWAFSWSALPHLVGVGEVPVPSVGTWVQTGRWLAPDGPFAVSLSAAQSDPEHVELLLQPRKGGAPAHLRLSRSTWLPSSLTVPTSQREETWTFRDYRSACGITVAHQIERSTSGGKDTFRVAAVRGAPAYAGNPFAPLALTVAREAGRSEGTRG